MNRLSKRTLNLIDSIIDTHRNSMTPISKETIMDIAELAFGEGVLKGLDDMHEIAKKAIAEVKTDG